MQVLRFYTSLKCNNCIKTIEPGLNSITGVKSWRVDLSSKPSVLEVEAEKPVSDKIIMILKNAGYKIEAFS